RRLLLTLAIETSCDDTAVAVLEKIDLPNSSTAAILHFHKKITSDNTAYNGVHPLASLYSHQENLASLVDEAIQYLPARNGAIQSSTGVSVGTKRLPDFVSVTRGPGMRSSLFTGLDTAKGLAAAWQAHALTPRLVAALQNAEQQQLGSAKLCTETPVPSDINIEPSFPFLSVLASGGHTLLICSTSLTEHEILGSTADIAVGECLDKIARVVLPPDVLQQARSTMYGALLEDFAFPNMLAPESEQASETKQQGTSRPIQYALEQNPAQVYQAAYASRYAGVLPEPREDQDGGKKAPVWTWKLTRPLSRTAGGLKSKSLEMSFSGLTTAVERVIRYETNPSSGTPTRTERIVEEITLEERQGLAKEAMRFAFEHIASRVVLALQHLSLKESRPPATIVMSGGVASNSYLRYLLARVLVANGYPDIHLAFPPASLCTDNAAMIGWTGLEASMYQAGHKDPRSIRALRKWPLDQLLSP
ncbi:hypothetical protein K491DRAFT_571016, partial [Lophiostoma macrostomum CBS 122681]